MGNSDHYKETQILLSNQRKKFLGVIVLVSLIAAGLIASTVVLAIKVSKAYPSAHVEYHVWGHQEALEGSRNFKTFKVPDKATVYALMEHAVDGGGSQFRYDYTQYEFGKSITSIGGIRESPIENLYWMLYKLSDSPDPNNPPTLDSLAEFGVDGQRVQDGEIYLFWLTKMDYPSSLKLKKSQQNLGAVSQFCIDGRIKSV